MLTDWSDTPPTEPGYYWLISRDGGEPFSARLTTHKTWITNTVQATSSWTAARYSFGSRIPSNAELLAMHKQIAELKATCIAYETDEHGIRQTLGVALGYPQDEHGEVCVGNTTAAKLAEEAARKIATLTEQRHAQYREMHEVEAVLGKALMYPYIYIDPVTNMVVSPEFPGAVKTDDICIGDHVTVSLAMEAARKIATLTAERDAAEAELEAATQRLIDAEVA